tara:strand:- start:715 stop:1269 length:555 start_codon:yes stop_codon:yes gene_type:complete
MRFLKSILLLLCCFFIVTTCEKDDICANSTPTTPRMVVSFKDIVVRENLKTVNNFRAQGVGNDAVLTGFNNVDVSEVILPLKIDVPNIEITTQYELSKDVNEVDDNGTPNDPSDDIELVNSDIITITYIVREIYVSPACGYKVQFENVSITIEPDADNWILLSEPENDNLIITDETITHYNLFH